MEIRGLRSLSRWRILRTPVAARSRYGHGSLILNGSDHCRHFFHGVCGDLEAALACAMIVGHAREYQFVHPGAVDEGGNIALNLGWSTHGGTLKNPIKHHLARRFQIGIISRYRWRCLSWLPGPQRCDSLLLRTEDQFGLLIRIRCKHIECAHHMGSGERIRRPEITPINLARAHHTVGREMRSESRSEERRRGQASGRKS